MSGKISEYTNEALVIGDDDWFDISVDTGSGFESKKLKGATVKALISAGVNLATDNLIQIDGARTYNGDGGDLTFSNGKTLTISDYDLIVNDLATFNNTTTFGSNHITESAVSERGIQAINTDPTAIASNTSIALIDTSSSAIEITLPSAVTWSGRKITVIDSKGNSASNNITITPDGAQTINGEANAVIADNFAWLVLHSDGSNWVARTSHFESETGWASYFNDGYAATSALTVAADTDTVLNPVGPSPDNIETQLPSDITTYFNASGEILGKEGDAVNIQIGFKATPSAVDQWCDFWLDIGGSIGEIYRQTFIFPKGSGVERYIVYSLPSIYQLDTWEANGATLNIRSNDSLDVRDFKVNVTRVHKAK
jgi:hypothetical protein